MVNDVLTTSRWHSFGVFDRAGKDFLNALIAPGFFTLAAGSTEALFLYIVGAYQACRFFVYGSGSWW
jgi:hypothetical protein